MQRHSRTQVRNQRERMIRRRRQQFAGWLGHMDWHAFWTGGAPRPLEVVEAEFWTPRRMGLFAQWNGVCSCEMCRGRKARQGRARLKAEMRRMVAELAV